MKEDKKKKIISMVESFDKKIGDTKSRLDRLEERKEAVIAESVVETLKESNYTLGDFFRIMEKQAIEQRKKTGDKPEELIPNNFNGGKNE